MVRHNTRKKHYRQVPYAILGRPKSKEREQAITLRMKGLSYNEILAEVPVAKSSLSLWLRSVGLSSPQKQRLTERRLAAVRRGGALRKRQRIASTERITSFARSQIGKLSARELWLIGVALYWAEGSKAKEYNPSVGVLFSNSDPFMLKLFKRWLTDAAEVNPDDIHYQIYLHRSHAHRLKEVQGHWSKTLSVPLKSLGTVYFKNNIISTNRKNTNNGYYGLIRIRVSGSTKLNRSITGWIAGIA